MIEEVLHPNNMMKALQSVVSNGGSAGVDGMGVKDLKAYYRENKTPLLSSLHLGHTLLNPFWEYAFRRVMEKPAFWVFPPYWTDFFSRQ